MEHCIYRHCGSGFAVLLSIAFVSGTQPASGQQSFDISGGDSLAFPMGGGQPAPPALRAPVLPANQVTRAFKIAQRDFAKQIRRIRTKYLGKKKHEPTRQRGLRELSRFTQAAAIEPLLEVCRKEAEDVQQWFMEHLQYTVPVEVGQPTLAWLAVYDNDPEMRRAARAHLGSEPPLDKTRWMLKVALTSANNDVVNAGALAIGQMKLIEAIPALIAAQAAFPAVRGGGDLAFIQVGTTRFFVSDLQPVVGDSSAGFDPTLSTLREGTVVAIQDAVVQFLRPPVHDTLVELASAEFGRHVDFGYDIPKWRQWYDDQYKPFDAERAKRRQEGDGG